MAKLHFLVGLIFFIIFLATGFYMFQEFPELYNGDQAMRLMYRSTHIYLLMSALINLMAFNYFQNHSSRKIAKVEYLCSGLLLIAPLLMLLGFIYEPPELLMQRPFSFWGVISLVSGVLLLTLMRLIKSFYKIY